MYVLLAVVLLFGLYFILTEPTEPRNEMTKGPLTLKLSNGNEVDLYRSVKYPGRFTVILNKGKDRHLAVDADTLTSMLAGLCRVTCVINSWAAIGW